MCLMFVWITEHAKKIRRFLATVILFTIFGPWAFIICLVYFIGIWVGIREGKETVLKEIIDKG